MKKSLIAGLIALMFVTQSLAPKRADALVGLVMVAFGGAGVPLIITGGAITAAGVITVATSPKSNGNFDGLFQTLIGITVGALGLIVLDDKAVQVPQFNAITDSQAKAVGISDEEAKSFNEELDEINVITQSVTKTTVADGKPTIEKASAAWSELKGGISKEAYSALVKLSANMHKTVAERM